ncbi:MAG: phosphoribosylglycinamide formyltransferase [Aeromonadaceae bacterium]
MMRFAVLISGNGSNLQALIDACQAGRIQGELVGVVSNRADAFGLERAKAAGIATQVLSNQAFADRESYDAALIQALESWKPDLLVMAGFMRILTPGFVQHFAGRMLNIHPSLLPKYQGVKTHARAIAAGDTVHGASVHFVTEELDGGPVVLQARVPIFPDDDEVTLAERVLSQEHQIYPLVVNWFCQGRLTMVGTQACLDGQPLPTRGYASDDEEFIDSESLDEA